MTQVKAIIWDFDGVLLPYHIYPEHLDITEIHLQAVSLAIQDVARDEGMMIDVGEARQLGLDSYNTYGEGVTAAYKKYRLDRGNVHRAFHDNLYRIAVEDGWKPDSCAALKEELRHYAEERGGRHAVLTHACASNWVEPHLDSLGYRAHINHVVDLEAASFCPKGHGPEPFQKMALDLSCAFDEMVMVEDSIRNLKHAKALGMKTVLINWGCDDKYSPDYAAFVDVVFSCPEDFCKAFREKGDALFPDERRSSIFVPRQPAIVTSLTPS